MLVQVLAGAHHLGTWAGPLHMDKMTVVASGLGTLQVQSTWVGCGRQQNTSAATCPPASKRALHDLLSEWTKIGLP